MPPKKKLRSSSSTTTTNSNSLKKSTQNQNQNTQPSKYGIQHFFQRHSQQSQPKSLPQDPNLHSKQPHLVENGLKGFNSVNNESSRKPGPVVGNPDGENPNLENPGGKNPNFENPDGKNPNFENPDGKNPNFENPDGKSPNFDCEGFKRVDGELGRNPNFDCKGPTLGESGLKGFRRVNGEVGQSKNPKKGLVVKGFENGVEKIRVCESKESVLVDDVIDCDEVSDISPDVSQLVPKKRFKFSPGMIIKQSQDDGGEEVTWKISPVNERLQAISKIGPDVVNALARASRLNSSSFERMSDDTGPRSHCLAPSAKGNSVSSSEILKKLPVLSNGSSLNKPSEDQGTNGKNRNDNAIDLNNVGSFSSQSPFRTPPSLSHCHDKPVHSAVSEKSLREFHGLRQHKKTLLELLDQVENVISVEGPNVHSPEPCNDSTNKINPNIPEIAMNTTEEADLVSCDPLLLVLEVTDKRCSSSADGALCSTKVLRVLNEQRGEELSVRLWDDWIYSVIEPGDTIRVIGEFDSQGICDVNHEKNLLIIHPNLLLSGTRVAGSFSCPRRAVLDERLKSNEYSVAALVGTLLHQIFQAGLLMDNPTIDHLHEFSKIALQKNIESLFACGVQENDMQKTLNEAIPKICKWILLFRHSESSSSPTIDFGLNDGLRKMSLSDVIDIEEMAWAPKYGLKGIIDASIRVKLHSNNNVIEKIMPLEFKTGKATTGQSLMEHSAQLILYTLLMSERYLQDIDSGLLYYLSTDQTLGINVRRSDLIGLIMRRNELAHDIIKASMVEQLPPMLQSPNVCKGCRHLNSCTVYHKVHGGSAKSSGLGDLFDTLTNHLTTTHKVFFKHWDRLIDLEAKELQVSKNMARRSHVSRNESSSSGVSSVVLEASNEVHLQTYGKDNRFVYRFVHKNKCFSNGRRHNDNLNDNNHVSAETDIDSSLRNGDRVILSAESTQLAVASGIVTDICRSHVSVSFSKRLQLPWSTRSLTSRDIYKEVWRIDKDEVASSYATMRFNLVQLFLQNECNSHLRKLIVDLEAPRFDSGSILSQDPAISYVWSERNLNDDQRRAIIKILTAKDYALILGMPGTGKTSTMVYAVKALLMRGASILLTSYTNSAVDNLLIKLKAQGIDFVRIGRYEVLHKEVQGHCLSDMDVHSVEEIKLKMDQVKVVAVTCLGITSPLLANKKFDVCIIDEAGQTSLPVSLGPLMFASMFVLVGDHYQLPPLVKNAEARESGMSVSLFRRLSEQHPQAISPLQNQYRMCAGIMSLSNTLIYGDRLRCGSSDVENAKLQLSNLGSLSSWLKKVLEANKPVIFVNTDVIPAFETKEQKAVVNRTEAQIVAELVNALANHGVEKEEIGIITPYNAQANLIQQVSDMTSVEVHTIDKYQGRDKDCILVSFVRSSQNPTNCSSSLLGDWHRINVALTRAKKKLIMIGSCRTLARVPLLRLLIDKVEEQSGILCITRNDIEGYSQLRRCSESHMK